MTPSVFYLILPSYLAWAESMTWKGKPPIVTIRQEIYQKGIFLTKKAMAEIEMRILRNPSLPKWDILIRHH